MTDSKKSGLFSQHTRTSLLICLVAIGIVLGGFLVWLHVVDPSTSRYEPLLAMIAQDQLAMDRPGHINLSEKFPGLTPRDEMMLTRRGDGSFLAMFPTKYGEGTEVTGLMYTSRALREEDTFLRKSSINFSDHLIAVGTYGALLIDDRINDHWYHVSYRIR